MTNSSNHEHEEEIEEYTPERYYLLYEEESPEESKIFAKISF